MSIRELVLNLATANGLLRVLMYSGKPYADAERDFQNAVRAVDAALASLEDGVSDAIKHIGVKCNVSPLIYGAMCHEARTIIRRNINAAPQAETGGNSELGVRQPDRGISERPAVAAPTLPHDGTIVCVVCGATPNQSTAHKKCDFGAPYNLTDPLAEIERVRQACYDAGISCDAVIDMAKANAR